MSFGLEDHENPTSLPRPLSGRRKVVLPEWRTVDIAEENPDWLDLYIPDDAQSSMFDFEDIDLFLPSACKNGYDVKHFIAEGASGKVFDVCKDNVCGKVLKVVPFVSNENDENDFDDAEAEFMTEAEYTYLMGRKGIGPLVYDYWLCPRMARKDGNRIKLGPGGMMVVRKMDMTLHDYAEEQTETIKHNFDAYKRKKAAQAYLDTMKQAKEKLIKKLHLMDTIKYMGHTYVHEDIHAGNVMVNLSQDDGHIRDIRFVDFGKISVDDTISEAEQQIVWMFANLTAPVLEYTEKAVEEEKYEEKREEVQDPTQVNKVKFRQSANGNIKEYIIPMEKGNVYADSIDCLQGYEVSNFIGGGFFGVVLQGCIQSDCSYAIKIQEILAHHTAMTPVKFESNVTKRASELGVTPKFIEYIECTGTRASDGSPVKLGIIVTEKWDTDLDTFVNSKRPLTGAFQRYVPSWVIDKLEKQVDILHKNNIIHNDMRSSNVVLRLSEDNTITDVALVDFGLARVNGKGWAGQKNDYNADDDYKLVKYYREGEDLFI